MKTDLINSLQLSEQVKMLGMWGTGCRKMLKVFEAVNLLCQDKCNLLYADEKHITDSDDSALDYCREGSITFYSGNHNKRIAALTVQMAQLMLVNAYHLEAPFCILLLDGEKQFKPDQRLLASTIAVFYVQECSAVVEKLKTEELLHRNASFYPLNYASLATYIMQYALQHIPPVFGLVLGGGNSSRMGTDKLMVSIDGKTQAERMFELMDKVCEKTFLSVQQGVTKVNVEYYSGIITDSFLHLGPLSGILSAFRAFPHAAWLVAPCDMALLQESDINHLLDQREASSTATCFRLPHSDPEPFPVLLEPAAYAGLLQWLGSGNTSLRIFLKNNRVKYITPEHQGNLTGFNTQEELNRLLDIRERRKSPGL